MLTYFTFRSKYLAGSDSKMYRQCHFKKYNESSNDFLILFFLLNEQVKSTRPRKKRSMALQRKKMLPQRRIDSEVTTIFILTLIRHRR